MAIPELHDSSAPLVRVVPVEENPANPVRRSRPSSVTKAMMVVAFLLLGRKVALEIKNIIIHPATIPFDPAQHEGDYNALWESERSKIGTWKSHILCYAPLEQFKELAARQEGEKRIIADYYYGRRLACSRHANDPIAISEENHQRLWQERAPERMQGLSLMYQTGGLKIRFPKKGRSFEQLFFDYARFFDTSTYYWIDECWYFTSGTLLCPDKEAFEKLKLRFKET